MHDMTPQTHMSARFRSGLLFLSSFAVCVTSVACRHREAAPAIPMRTVMQTIRDYGRAGKLAPAQKVQNTDLGAGSPQLYDLEETYQAHIKSGLAEEDFANLESEVRDARVAQARARGGVWKLLLFYEAVSSPLSGREATDSDWQDHFALIRKWTVARPGSAAAHIAMADAYVNYAWAARGNGYANTVSGSGWKHFNERIGLAKAKLIDAAKTEEKCPYWYEVMQMIAVAEGWDKQQARELFDKATAFSPNYYHYYREYANFLLPKWYGEEGEMQAFAEEVFTRLPEPDSSIVYFEMASLLACQCDNLRDSLDGLSWPRIQQGYKNLERLYGTSKLKSNRFAYMSYLAKDKAAAQEAFNQVGDDWEQTVWQTVGTYQVTKKWAFSE